MSLFLFVVFLFCVRACKRRMCVFVCFCFIFGLLVFVCFCFISVCFCWCFNACYELIISDKALLNLNFRLEQ